MNTIIYLLIILIIKTNGQSVSEWKEKQFTELCQTYHQEDFAPLFNQFKTEYPKQCPNNLFYGSNGTNIICMKCIKGNYIRNDGKRKFLQKKIFATITHFLY